MKKNAILAVFTALLFSAAAAGAAEADRPDEAPYKIVAEIMTTTPQVSTAAAQLAPRYTQEIQSALKHLSALLSKNPGVDQAELDSVAGEIVKLDARVKNLLGPNLIREAEARENELMGKARIVRAKEALAETREALMLYYGDLEGRYPATPAELIPKYMPTAPELELPGHSKTAAVEMTDSTEADIAGAVTDTGGWLYFANPRSQNFGMLALNCTHKDAKGVELHKY